MCDDVVAQLTSRLEEKGITEDTIFVFASDNGCSPMADFKALARYDHSPIYVFRGAKADIYEGGHRIPLLVRWPAQIRAGSRCGETVCLADLYATMAEVTGTFVPDEADEDSVSNLPLWMESAGDASLREATVYHSIDGSFSLRKGRP